MLMQTDLIAAGLNIKRIVELQALLVFRFKARYTYLQNDTWIMKHIYFSVIQNNAVYHALP